MKTQDGADGPASFQLKLDRLKECLGVSEDQQVAAALGLSKTALSLRKNRGSFPAERVYALAASRPEVDPVYVLTGDIGLRSRVHSLVRVNAHLTSKAPGLGIGADDQVDRLAVDFFKEKEAMRAERRPLYSEIIDLLDTMSAYSVHLIRQLAEKVSFADQQTELQRLRWRREARQEEARRAQSPGAGDESGEARAETHTPPASRRPIRPSTPRRRK